MKEMIISSIFFIFANGYFIEFNKLKYWHFNILTIGFIFGLLTAFLINYFIDKG